MKTKIYTIAISTILSCSIAYAQNVGIGNPLPNSSAKLDVSDPNRGVLIPRVALTARNTAGPVAAPATSLLVYNTATAGIAPNNVTPGYYYNAGTPAAPNWMRFSTGGDDWKINGNANTVSGTQFLGTTNGQALDFRTNNTLRFRVANGNQVHAMSNGSAALPFYSWDIDPNTGIYRIGTDILGFSTNSTERLRMSNTASVFNEGGLNYDFRVETDLMANMFFVDGGTNRIGINTATPANVIDFRTTGENIWLTYWENNHASNGALAQWYHTNASNSKRVAMGITNYSGSTYETPGLMGLSINNTTVGSGGIGVLGSANNESGNAVEGSLFFSGGYSGWSGYFNADVYSGGIYIGSDRRLKRDISPINSALDLIKMVEPVSYYYDTETYPQIGLDEERLTYGFIAQDLEEVLPELVKEKNLVVNSNRQRTSENMSDNRQVESFKVVNYTLMIPILTKAIKEQQDIINTQNERIEALERLVNQILERE